MRIHLDPVACQDGNGGAAMADGRHSSQRSLSGGALVRSINEARNLQNLDTQDSFSIQKPFVQEIVHSSSGPILISDTGPILFDGEKIGRKTYEFKVGTRKVEVVFEYDKGESPIKNGVKNGDWVSVGFSVNGGFTTSNRSSRGSSEIASTVNQVFRQEVKQRPEGTLFQASAALGDSRVKFREAMYARAGLSFGYGTSSPSDGSAGGSQYGAKVDGKLVPSDRSRVFSSEEQRTHRASVRSAIREGIREARRDQNRVAS